MSVLITGGFGYLGGRLAQFLASENGYDVTLGSRKQKVSPFWLPQAKVIKSQWSSSIDLEQACIGVDTIVHLAGMNAQDCTNDPVAALSINAVATTQLLHAAIRKGVKRFIYISTAHVYDAHLTGTITEDICPVNLHPYATSHRAGEDVVRAAYQNGEIEGVVLRLSNACGAPAYKEVNCWMLLMNDLCLQAVTTELLVLRSSGTQYRDFIPISDAVRAVLHFIECPESILDNGLFNIGGGRSIKVIDLAERIIERCHILFGFKSAIQFSQKRDSGKTLQPLDYRIDKVLNTGFQLKGSIEDEIDATLKFCRVNLAPLL